MELPHVDESGELISHVKANTKRLFHDVDLLIIGTPPFAHEKHAILSMSEGVPVLCEKPCCVSSENVDNMIAYSKSSGVPVGVNYQLRCDDALFAFSKEITSFIPDRIEIIYRSGARLHKSAFPAWYKLRHLGGGVQFSILSHLIDMTHYIGLVFKDVFVNSYYPRTSCSNALFCDALDIIEVTANTYYHHNKTNIITRISINTLDDINCFYIMVMGKNKCMALDMISGNIYTDGILNIKMLHHENNNLSSLSDRPWRKPFHNLISSIVNSENGNYLNLSSSASLEDSIKVHNVINMIERSCET